MFSSSLTVRASEQDTIWNVYPLTSNNKAIILNDVIWDGDQYIAVGNSGWVATSKTGVKWDYKKITADDINLMMVTCLNEDVFIIGCKEVEEKQYSRFIFKKDQYGGLSLNASGIEANLHYDIKSVATDNKNALISIGGKFINYKPSGLIMKASLRSLFREVDNDNNKAALSTYLNSIAWGKDKFVAVGMNMKCITSSDGDTWENATYKSSSLALSNNINLHQVIWTGTQFIAVGDQATILVSKDGLVWDIIKNNLGKDKNILSITSNGKGYVISGDNGFCASSVDIKNWNIIRTKISDDFRKAVASGNSTVAITNKSSVLVGTVKVNSKPINSEILVNGKKVNFEAYSVEGNTYFKLRDIAYVINGTSKQFDVTWDKVSNSISLLTGKSYQRVGGELESSDKKEAGTTTLTDATIMIDGTKVNLAAFSIGGNNYFKLRDLGKLLDFGVQWNNDLKRIEISTSSSYIP